MNKQQLRALEAIHEMAEGDNMSPEEIASLLEANCGIQTMTDEVKRQFGNNKYIKIEKIYLLDNGDLN